MKMLHAWRTALLGLHSPTCGHELTFDVALRFVTIAAYALANINHADVCEARKTIADLGWEPRGVIG